MASVAAHSCVAAAGEVCFSLSLKIPISALVGPRLFDEDKAYMNQYSFVLLPTPFPFDQPSMNGSTFTETCTTAGQTIGGKELGMKSEEPKVKLWLQLCQLHITFTLEELQGSHL